ncbi:hypothetical protein SAY87_019716 [Trapa incisa]|uniref:Uncharacterized protein n=1 Tax=Trapa incisa TaxID=236973 RepID=A0AAN7K0A2_9MYRT|nr:hypothetical protein SAY87_019716 [Trapa incisa]
MSMNLRYFIQTPRGHFHLTLLKLHLSWTFCCCSRGTWEIPRRDLNTTAFLATPTADNEFSDTDLEDLSAPSPRGLICCRVVAIIFMVLLVLHHTLPILISGAGDYSLTLYTVCLSVADVEDSRNPLANLYHGQSILRHSTPETPTSFTFVHSHSR